MQLKKFLHENHEKFDNNIAKLKDENIIERLFNKDYKLWSEDPTEISNRLDWLDSPTEYFDKIEEINKFVEQIKNDNFQKVVLLGMGGSSLAPEVFQKVFGVNNDFLELFVLDSTHPEAIRNIENKIKDYKTLFIVSTKSGGTVETLSFTKYFYLKYSKLFDNPGNYFTAITDPGSGLKDIAEELKFRKIFINNPNIGGRFSALSFFGLVPAALVGVDLSLLLTNAKNYREKLINNSDEAAFLIGAILGLQANEGIDKLTLISSNEFKPVGAWVEQLVAESTGKIGSGILPVDLEELRKPQTYSKDRLFVFTRLEKDDSKILKMKNFVRCGFNVIDINLENIYELASLFLLWEIGTAVAGHILKIHPFDQPDVESAKIAARNVLKQYAEEKKLNYTGNLIEGNEFNLRVNQTVKEKNKKEVLENLASSLKNLPDEIIGRKYISIQAFILMNEENEKLLLNWQNQLSEKYKVAVTVGFGPRFLHSTGQLHKGDSGNGIFLQFVDNPNLNLSIPNSATSEESNMSFDILVQAQALGDREALLSKNRSVLRFEIKTNLEKAISEIMEYL